MNFEQAWATASSIEGWLTEGQGKMLFEGARTVHPGDWIVEIGSHHGRSTVLLAAGSDAASRVAAVDPFDNPRWGGGPQTLQAFTRNVADAGVRERVEPLRMLSFEAAAEWPHDRRIGLLYIDGAHDLASVLTDIDVWRPSLAKDAKVYFHDAFSAPGVTEALLRRFTSDRSATYQGSERSLAMFQIGDRLSTPALVANRVRLYCRLLYFARNTAIKVGKRRNLPIVVCAMGWKEEGYPY